MAPDAPLPARRDVQLDPPTFLVRPRIVAERGEASAEDG
jgi:hypothetical protein